MMKFDRSRALKPPPQFVMPGLVPGIHAFLYRDAKDVDGRDV
jgi:hypothetical protein